MRISHPQAPYQGVAPENVFFVANDQHVQMGTGYVVGFLVYQIGTLITEGTLGAGFIPGLIAVAAITGIIAYLCVNAGKKVPVKK